MPLWPAQSARSRLRLGPGDGGRASAAFGLVLRELVARVDFRLRVYGRGIVGRPGGLGVFLTLPGPLA